MSLQDGEGVFLETGLLTTKPMADRTYLRMSPTPHHGLRLTLHKAELVGERDQMAVEVKQYRVEGELRAANLTQGGTGHQGCCDS